LQSPESLSNQFRRLKERPRLSSAIAVNSTLVRMLGAHRECDSTARGELRRHDRLARRACFHEVIQNAVRDRFIERVLIPIRSKIKFERLAFNAETIRDVIDLDPGEVCLAGHRTERCEIIRLKMDVVISPCRVWKSLEARFRRRGR
jgi:hypothetical protein